jgi:hypothetical protein
MMPSYRRGDICRCSDRSSNIVVRPAFSITRDRHRARTVRISKQAVCPNEATCEVAISTADTEKPK